MPKHHKGGPLKIGPNASLTNKSSKVKNFFGGFGHPNFMNHFVYGKSLLGKSFPKRIGTLTLPNPKIFDP